MGRSRRPNLRKWSAGLFEDALSSIEDEEAWRRAMVLQVTCSPQELLDPELPADDLLYRLFHEEGVRAFKPRPLDGRCRCSRQRLEGLLVALPAEDVATMKVDGEVQATCEFCNTIYRFDEAALGLGGAELDADIGNWASDEPS